MKQKNHKHNKDWLDWWLSDEPPTPEIEAKLKEPLLPDPESAATKVTVAVPKISFKRFEAVLPQREFARIAVFAVCMMLLGLAAHTFIFKPPVQAASSGSQQVLSATTAPGQSSINSISIPTDSNGVDGNQASSNAPFTSVVPATKPQLGSYNSGTGIFSFSDSIPGDILSVSEQPLPTIYKNATDALTKISTSIGATQMVSTNNGDAYIYTNPKNGQQTVVFSMKGLYIYINSKSTHGPNVWKAYINTLE